MKIPVLEEYKNIEEKIIKYTNNAIIKDIRNLFRLENENKAIKYRILK